MSHAVHQLNPPDVVPIRRALLSVSDKTGLVELARALVAGGVELLSTGGTHKTLSDAGLPVIDVADYTGSPEMLDGRVKTLHPRLHGGILALRDLPEHQAALRQHNIPLIDLVVVNLYPFAQTIARPDVTDALAIENIDIGGPSLIRGAAKNHVYTAVATAPGQYGRIAAEFSARGGTSLALRRELAQAAYALTADYDSHIAAYFTRTAAVNPVEGETASNVTGTAAETTIWPERLTLSLARVESLRYGENPHQSAALYRNMPTQPGTLLTAEKLHGKELSYNNLLDLDAAWSIVRMLPEAAAVVIKHNNPCGAAQHAQLSVAARRAWDGDPVSAFGSVLGFNRPVDIATAEMLCEPDRFVEAIIAPAFEPAALELLTTKPKWRTSVRLLALGSGAWVAGMGEAAQPGTVRESLRQIDGGWLAQEADTLPDDPAIWRVATATQPADYLLRDLRFAWAIVRHVKSNAILLAKGEMTLGVGAGQMSRVDAVEIAIRKAGERAEGSVLASDAFFPFADSVALAAAAGVRAIIQPGGSKRDAEVIAACDAAGIPLILTGKRHFKH
ncbi:MAG: bifunctional phosphoribosylaminoimidazolecarboxamide formyltransferase/IMP cyclohydrolase [Pirellulales bacterium]|nr:bifunctional phosphoribosylaminoimidazolecarboxamide formyltransferase/IMP cyclohydrolase [Pirellulales bacterium]